MNTYEGYLENSKGSTLTIEESKEIYRSIVDSIKKCTLEDKIQT